MKKKIRFKLILFASFLIFISCEKGILDDDFLERHPLSNPSSKGFWTSAKNAEFWINDLYRGLPYLSEMSLGPTEGSSDNAWARVWGQIGNGSHTPSSKEVRLFWDYGYIRAGLTFLERIDEVPDIDEITKNSLIGQAKFFIAFKYYELITVYRDVPLVTEVLSIEDSDLPKSPKNEVLEYLLIQLDDAIDLLPESWSAEEDGRITKGAALALKARVLLYNERWGEAAGVAKEIINSGLYELHPNFGELFLREFNNRTNEVILARQYVQGLTMNSIFTTYAFMDLGGFGSILPSETLVNSYEMIDGLPINESPLYDANDPLANRDPRLYETCLLPFESISGVYFDPVNGSPPLLSQNMTNIYFRKYVNDMQPGESASGKNQIIIRYADVLLMYAEAQNENNGPDDSVYEAIDLIRSRAGMPNVDRSRYSTKGSLRELIRNERRVELAGEALRYFDIIRWRIAEDVLNGPMYSFEIPGVLSRDQISSRIFDPNKHYVWPIPQFTIDDAKNLEQHSEWK